MHCHRNSSVTVIRHAQRRRFDDDRQQGVQSGRQPCQRNDIDDQRGRQIEDGRIRQRRRWRRRPGTDRRDGRQRRRLDHADRAGLRRQRHDPDLLRPRFVRDSMLGVCVFGWFGQVDGAKLMDLSLMRFSHSSSLARLVGSRPVTGPAEAAAPIIGGAALARKALSSAGRSMTWKAVQAVSLLALIATVLLCGTASAQLETCRPLTRVEFDRLLRYHHFPARSTEVGLVLTDGFELDLRNVELFCRDDPDTLGGYGVEFLHAFSSGSSFYLLSVSKFPSSEIADRFIEHWTKDEGSPSWEETESIIRGADGVVYSVVFARPL